MSILKYIKYMNTQFIQLLANFKSNIVIYNKLHYTALYIFEFDVFVNEVKIQVCLNLICSVFELNKNSFSCNIFCGKRQYLLLWGIEFHNFWYWNCNIWNTSVFYILKMKCFTTASQKMATLLSLKHFKRP